VTVSDINKNNDNVDLILMIIVKSNDDDNFFVGFKIFLSMSLQINGTYSRVQVGKLLSNMLPINSGLNQGNVSSMFFFNFALDYAIRTVQVNLEILKFNGTHQLLYFVDVVHIMGRNILTYKEKHRTL
jgi:hypothetical protein